MCGRLPSYTLLTFDFLKIDTLVTPPLDNVHTSFGFRCLFIFELETRTGADGKARRILQPMRTSAVAAHTMC